MREYALVLLVTAAVTYLLVPLVRRFAIAVGAVPPLRPRDMHTEPTPRLGGLAMFGGLIAGLLVASRLTNLQDPFRAAGSKTQSGLLLAGGLIVVIGFIDDRWGLSAISKLAGQVAAAGILWWSGLALPWFPEPDGHELILQPDLSVTLTILLVVVTINAINFIDGMDGLAAGIVAVTALGFLVYSYWLVKTIDLPSESLPAVSSAVLAGMCIGFLPHNFYPARIFMGDTGAMLLGLLLAYGPISSTGSIDDAVLVNYAQHHTINRFGTVLPLLVPAAIFLIPYTDLMLAVIRRTRRGTPLMGADREHLHHRLINVGHSYRQSVLIMWLWAALLSATVVALSLVRTHLWILAVATVAAVLLLLPVTMPSLRPWRRHVDEAADPVPSSSAAPAPVAAAPVAAAPVARITAAGAFAVAPITEPRVMPVLSPEGFGDGAPDGVQGDRGFVPGRGAVPGGPPPGFEPVPAPPGLGGNGGVPGGARLWSSGGPL
ncbi:MAG TPA: MraY family glycosyltransferase, partial [Streptosporangiaceae bacterium]